MLLLKCEIEKIFIVSCTNESVKYLNRNYKILNNRCRYIPFMIFIITLRYYEHLCLNYFGFSLLKYTLLEYSIDFLLPFFEIQKQITIMLLCTIYIYVLYICIKSIIVSSEIITIHSSKRY